MRSRDSAEMSTCAIIPGCGGQKACTRNRRPAQGLMGTQARSVHLAGHTATREQRTQPLSSNIMLRIPHVSTHARDRAAACYHGCPAMVSAGIKTKGSRARNQENKKETRAVKTCAARLRRVHLGTRCNTQTQRSFLKKCVSYATCLCA